MRRGYRKKNEPLQNFPIFNNVSPIFHFQNFLRFASANVAVVWIRAWKLLLKLRKIYSMQIVFRNVNNVSRNIIAKLITLYKSCFLIRRIINKRYIKSVIKHLRLFGQVENGLAQNNPLLPVHCAWWSYRLAFHTTIIYKTMSRFLLWNLTRKKKTMVKKLSTNS